MSEYIRADVLYVAENIRAASLKRIAWAYGCAKKGSDEERALLAVLVERIQGGAK